MNHASGKASNAVLAKARALYGRRLRAEDYRRLTDCHTMTELANELKALPLYANTLAEVNPTYARRAQLENLLRQSQYERFDSLCRYDRSAGSSVYQYLTLCCEVDELTAALRCLDAGRPGDYLYRLPDFLEQRCSIDLYALAKATDLQSLLAAVQGTPWAKVLAPLANAKPDRGLTAQAEPLMQEYRHRALVAMAPKPAKQGEQPGLRELIELECDTSAVSNAARLIRVGAPAQRLPPRLQRPDGRRVGLPAGLAGSACFQAAVCPNQLRPAVGSPRLHRAEGRLLPLPHRLVPQVAAVLHRAHAGHDVLHLAGPVRGVEPEPHHRGRALQAARRRSPSPADRLRRTRLKGV